MRGADFRSLYGRAGLSQIAAQIARACGNPLLIEEASVAPEVARLDAVFCVAGPALANESAMGPAAFARSEARRDHARFVVRALMSGELQALESNEVNRRCCRQ